MPSAISHVESYSLAEQRPPTPRRRKWLGDSENTRPPAVENPMEAGCYLVKLTLGEDQYTGSFRVEHSGPQNLYSGDLYCTRIEDASIRPGLPPVFPLADYRSYIEVTRIRYGRDTEEGRFDFAIQLWDFEAAQGVFNPGKRLRGLMIPQANTDSSEPRVYQAELTGGLARGVIGRITLTKASDYLRRAVLEIDWLPDSELMRSGGAAPLPLENEDRLGWEKVFHKVGWKVEVEAREKPSPMRLGDRPISADEPWSFNQLHQYMLEHRDRPADRSEWRYHLLCVPRHRGSRALGAMYDVITQEPSLGLREGAAVFYRMGFKFDDERWGAVRGKSLTEVPGLYFRTAVHEVGHAMGLWWESWARHRGFMTQTAALAEDQLSFFPDNVVWSFDPREARALRHMPDIWTRPGGAVASWGYYLKSISDPKAPKIDMRQDRNWDLKLTPLLDGRFPIGASVRVNLTLDRNDDQNFRFPLPEMSLKGGNLHVTVIDPVDEAHSIRPIYRTIRDYTDGSSEFGEGPRKKHHSLNLLRGNKGAIFKMPGRYRILVTLGWVWQRAYHHISAETEIEVTDIDLADPKRPVKVQFAHWALSNEALFLALALRSRDLLDQRNTSDQNHDATEDRSANGSFRQDFQALLRQPELGRHYAAVAAKAWSSPGLNEKPDFDAAADALADVKDPVMTHAEFRQLTDVAVGQPRTSESHERILRTLRRHTAMVDFDQDLIARVQQL